MTSLRLPVADKSESRFDYAGAWMACLRWMRNTAALLVTATALGWLVVTFSR